MLVRTDENTTRTMPLKLPPRQEQATDKQKEFPLPSACHGKNKHNGTKQTNTLEMPRSTDQEEMPEAVSSPAEFRDCKEECKLSWWAEDLSSK